ncbi:MAG: hypothetical protein U9Q90_02665 [Campylobacterota bacterium]|nr:hypothetical protein [Campylobacterota bacterium]
MKEIVDCLKEHNIICKSLKEVTPKELGSRKKVKIYFGVDLKDYYCIFIVVEKKSRVLRKEAAELMALHEKLEGYQDTKIMKRYIQIKAPLCSHAKAMLEESGWVVWHFEN